MGVRETIIRLTRLISYAQGLHTATESYTRLVRQKRGANTEQTDQTTTPCGLQSEPFLGRSDGAEGKSTHANTRATETTTTRMATDAASEAQHMRLRLAGMHSADAQSTANSSSIAAPATGPHTSTYTPAQLHAYETSERTRRGSKCRLDRLKPDELVYLLKRERGEASELQGEFAKGRIARRMAEKQAAAAQAKADALPGVVSKLKEAQRELKDSAAQRKRQAMQSRDRGR